MKHIQFFVAFLVLSTSSIVHSAPPVAARSSDITLSIVNAGQLRLQSQRLAKLWLQVGLGINGVNSQKQLSQGLEQFDRDLASLESYKTKEDIQKPMARVTNLWSDFRQALTFPYSTQNLNRVTYLADDLMWATGKLSMKIEEMAEGGAGLLLDLSLRQNMLAQRLARLYLMAQAGDKSHSRLVDIEQARVEFSSALDSLLNARENTQANREALELARMQWIFFDQAVSQINDAGKSRPMHVVTTSERILEVLNEVSHQYAQGKSNTSPVLPVKTLIETKPRALIAS